MVKRWVAGLAIAGLICGAGVMVVGSSGCGVVAAPVLLPAAVAANSNFQFQGKVVDENGVAMEGVVAKLSAVHYKWTPVEGGESTDNGLLRRVDRDFSFEARGTSFSVEFSKEGYYPVTYTMDREREKEFEVMQNGAEGVWSANAWPKLTKLQVVMTAEKKGRNVYMYSGTLNYRNFVEGDGIALRAESDSWGVLSKEPVVTDKPIADGIFYLVLVKGTPKAIDAMGTLDPNDLNLPEEMTLRISGKETGFVRIVPKFGTLPMVVSDEAPEEGYVPEYRIGRARLKEMREAKGNRVAEANEYFYFKSGDFFGKVKISWTGSGSPNVGVRNLGPAFRVEMYVGKKAGERRLISQMKAEPMMSGSS